MGPTYKVLILGASYGSLLASKMLMAGHTVSLVCRAKTATLINTQGTRVRMSVRGKEGSVEIDSRQFTGQLNALTPEQVDPQAFDLVCLAMQEPQYSESSVKALMQRIAQAAVPCMSIMNMPPLPYLARINGLATQALRPCFHDATVWDGFDPTLMTLCSPDPQAFRPPDEAANVLQVGLPTNFKVSSFAQTQHNLMLAHLEQGIAQARLMVAGEALDLPVKLKLHGSIFVPLAKWSMLLTGNYRCVQADSVRSIRDAVHSDLAASRAVYTWVFDLCVALGAHADDLVPFDKYAQAAQGLLKPSSAARALAAGATDIERIDLLVQAVAAQRGLKLDALDETVQHVNAWLAKNRQLAAATAN